LNTRSASLLVIFGVTGDLAQRKLLPSLHGLERDGLLPDSLVILGCARSRLDREAFRTQVARSIETETPPAERSDESIRRLLERLDYAAVDLSDNASMDACSKVSQHDATATSCFTCLPRRAGTASSAPAWCWKSRSATTWLQRAEINDDVGRYFQESQIFRIDHYLGKETVQNLMVLRFGNAIFEPLWRSPTSRACRSPWPRSVGVGSRAGFYDEHRRHARHGAEPPAAAAVHRGHGAPRVARPRRGARREAQGAALAAPDPQRPTSPRDTVRGQYSAGASNGVAAVGYLQRRTWAVRQQHRNLRGAQGPHQQLALGQRALLPAHRQAHGRAPVRDRDRVRRPALRHLPDSPHKSVNRLMIRLQPEEHIQLQMMAKARQRHEAAPGHLNLDLSPPFEHAAPRPTSAC
jgi:glucose-6-phosphate 1-dehydrogenase